MGILRRWRWWLVIIVVVGVVLFAAVRVLERPTSIDYYRLTTPNTIVVGVTGGRWTWLTRIDSIQEAASTVTITARTAYVGPGTAIGIPIEFTVTLRDPLGDRPVVDGTNGGVAVQTRCPPPLYLASGCVIDRNAR